MKKGILFIVFLMAAGMVSAQFYVGLGAGYGFSSPGEVVGTTTTYDDSGFVSEENIVGSLGGGINIKINTGFMFTENIGFDLGIIYFLGSELTSSETITPNGNATVVSKSSQLRLAPSVRLSTGEDLKIYTRAGLILPFGGSTVTNVTDETTPGNPVLQEVETKGAFSLGFQGALGVEFGMGDKLSLFGELSGVNLRIKSSSSVLNAYTSNGNDVLPSLTTAQKETNFVDELNTSSNNPFTNPSGFDSNSATDELSSRTNFNGFFINVGIRLSF